MQQVNTNTTAISQINNTKLPLYVKRVEQQLILGKNYTLTIDRDVSDDDNEYIKIRGSKGADVGVYPIFASVKVYKTKVEIEQGHNNYSVQSDAENNKIVFDANGLTITNKKKVSGVETSHELTFNDSGQLIRNNSHYLEVRGCYTTTTQPTIFGALYLVPTADVNKLNSEQFTSGRLLFYKDNSGKILEIYNTVNTAVVEENNVEYLALQKVGKVNQTYEHRIILGGQDGWKDNIFLTITTNSNVEFTLTTLKQWMIDNGFAGTTQQVESSLDYFMECSGKMSGTAYTLFAYNTTTDTFRFATNAGNAQVNASVSSYFKDRVRTL